MVDNSGGNGCYDQQPVVAVTITTRNGAGYQSVVVPCDGDSDGQ